MAAVDEPTLHVFVVVGVRMYREGLSASLTGRAGLVVVGVVLAAGGLLVLAVNPPRKALV